MEKKVCIGIKNEMKKCIRKKDGRNKHKETKKEWKKGECLERKR